MEMPTVPLFSDAALATLDRQQYDPTAKGVYELLSDALIWSDEFPLLGLSEGKVVRSIIAERLLLGYRVSLTLGHENAVLRVLWEQVEAHAPNWPGLRSERRGEKAKRRLLAAKRRSDACLDDLERQLDKRGG